jgi:hypothetical protein
MFTSNPFVELSASISPSVMQTYIYVMIILVAVGTIYDVLHKKSAKYFMNNMEKAKKNVTREVGGGEKVSLAVKTVIVDVAMSGEFCNPKRRIAHLLTMYGFIAYVVTTVMMIFSYETAATPAIVAQLWHLGARRRRGQFTVSHYVCRPVHSHASRKRDTGTGLVVSAIDG